MLGPMGSRIGGMPGTMASRMAVRRMMSVQNGTGRFGGMTGPMLGAGARTMRAAGGLVRSTAPTGRRSTGAEARQRARDVVAAARGERRQMDRLRMLAALGIGMGIGMGVGMAARACRHTAGSGGQMSEEMAERMSEQMAAHMSGDVSAPMSGRTGGGTAADPGGDTMNPSGRQRRR